MTEPVKSSNTTSIVLIVVAVVILLGCGGVCCMGMAGYFFLRIEEPTRPFPRQIERMQPPPPDVMRELPDGRKVIEADPPTPEELRDRFKSFEAAQKLLENPSVTPPGGAPPDNDQPNP